MTKPLPTVAHVDINRYLGKWYEIALIPNRFQSMCVSSTAANYAKDGENIKVTNRCLKSNGQWEEAQGTAHVVANSGNAKLNVSFFWPFYGDYWILYLSDDYQWVLVGEPQRKYGWVLSRSPEIKDVAFKQILDKAANLGYNTSAFRKTPQPQLSN